MIENLSFSESTALSDNFFSKNSFPEIGRESYFSNTGALLEKNFKDFNQLANKLAAIPLEFSIDSAFGYRSTFSPAEESIDLQNDLAISTEIGVHDPLMTSPLLEEFNLVEKASLERKELIFIDRSVEDYQVLLASLRTDIEVVFLDAEGEGIEQITRTLSHHDDIDTVHIVAHGGPGSINLGAARLDHKTLEQYAELLQSWSSAMNRDADLLIYGCNFASGAEGSAFAQSLSQLIQVDVAASDDLTGDLTLGGDWQLEFNTGEIESAVAFTGGVVTSYGHVLATIADTTLIGTQSFDEDVVFQGGVRLQDNVTLDVTGNVTINGSILGNGDGLADNLTLNVSEGTVTILGDVGLADLSNINISAQKIQLLGTGNLTGNDIDLSVGQSKDSTSESKIPQTISNVFFKADHSPSIEILGTASINANTLDLTASSTAIAKATGLPGTLLADGDLISVNSKPRVIIGANASITATGDVNLLAESVVSTESTLNASEDSKDTAIAAAVAVADVESTAIAKVSGDASLSVGGNLNITAKNQVDVTLLVDGSAAGSTAAGATVGVAVVKSETKAAIEDSASVTQTSKLDLEAQSATNVSATVKATPGGAKEDEKTKAKLKEYDAKTSEGDIEIAAAVAVTDVESDTQAYINSDQTVQASDQVLIESSAVTNAAAIADGSPAKGGSSGGGTAGIGVGVAINKANTKNRASIGENASVKGKGIIVNAQTQDVINSESDEVNNFKAEAISGVGSGEIGLAGSLALNLVSNETEAVIESGAAVEGSGEAASNAKVTAQDSVEHSAKAVPSGQAATSSQLGVGASVAANIVDQTTTAEIQQDATLLKVQDLNVKATSRQKLKTEAKAGAASSGQGIAIAPTAAISFTDNVTTAKIEAASQPLAVEGQLDIEAQHQGDTDTVASGEATGDSVTVGLALALNNVDSEVLATSQRAVSAKGDVTVKANSKTASEANVKATAKGAKKADQNTPKNGVDPKANQQKQFGKGLADDNDIKAKDKQAPSAKVAGNPGQGAAASSGTTISVAGAIGINLTQSKTEASIPDGGSVDADGKLTVQASGQSSVITNADGSTVDKEQTEDIGVGAAVAINDAEAVTNASIGKNANVSAQGVAVRADQATSGSGAEDTNTFKAEATSGAGAGDIGVAGSLGLNLVKNQTEAVIGEGTAINANGQDVELTAENQSKTTAKALPDKKGGGSGNTVGIGASVATNLIKNRTRAGLEKDTQLTGAKDLTVEAQGNHKILTEAKAGASTAKKGANDNSVVIAPTAAVAIVENETLADLAGGQDVAVSGNVAIEAEQEGKSEVIADGKAEGTGITLGLAVAVNAADDAVNVGLDRNLAAGGKVSFKASSQVDNSAKSTATATGAKQEDNAPSDGVDQQVGNQLNYSQGVAKEKGTQSKDKSFKAPSAKTSEGKVSISAAVSVNLTDSEATAQIGEGRTVTAGEAIEVVAINYSDASATADGSTLQPKDDSAENSSEIGVGAGVAINLADVKSKAEVGNGATIEAKGITLQAGTFEDKGGAPQESTNKFEATAVSGAGAEKVGVAGSLALNISDSQVAATVGEAAVLNAGGGDLSITAANNSNTELTATSDVKKGEGKNSSSSEGGSSVGVGASVALNLVNNSTQAKIQKDAQVTNVDDVTVKAASSDDSTTTAEGGAEGGIAVDASVAVVTLDRSTEAAIEAGEAIQATGNVQVESRSKGENVTKANAKTAAKNVGVGASVAVVLSQDKDNSKPISSAHVDRGITTQGDLDVLSNATHSYDTEAEASNKGNDGKKKSSSSESQKALKKDNAQSNNPNSAGTVDIAAAVALTSVNDDTTSYVDNGVVSVGGAVTVTAKNQSDFSSRGSGQSVSGKEINIGAGAGISLSKNDTTAYLNDGVIVQQASDISLVAESEQNISDNFKAKLAAEGVAAAGKSKTAAIAGSLGLMIAKDKTQAYLGNSVAIQQADDIVIRALDTSRVAVKAWAAAGSTEANAGVGAALALIVANKTNQAFVGDGGSIIDANSLVVEAKNKRVEAKKFEFNGFNNLYGDLLNQVQENNFYTEAISGTAAEDAAVSGSFAVNIFNLKTESWIGDDSVVTTLGNTLITSENNIQTKSIAGSLGVALNGVGVGIASADVSNTNITRSYLGSNITANIGGDLSLKATNQQEIGTFSVSVGVGNDAGVAGSVNVTIAKNTAEAFVTDSATTNLTVGNQLRIEASNVLNGISIAGGAAGGGTAGVGVSSITNVITGVTNAFVGKDVTAQVAGLTLVEARAEEDLLTVAAGGAVAGKISVSGSVIVNEIDQKTQAYIGDGVRLNALNSNPLQSQSVEVKATDQTNIFSVAGAVSVGGKAGIGAGSDVGVISKDTKAYIGSALVNADQNIQIEAFSKEDIDSIVAIGSFGGTVGVAASAGVYTIDNKTRAFIGDDPRDTVSPASTPILEAQGNIIVSALNDTELDLIDGNVTGAGSVGVGASASVPIVTKLTEAFIGQNAKVKAKAKRGAIEAYTGELTLGSIADSGSEGFVESNNNTLDFSRGAEVQSPGQQTPGRNSDFDGDGSNDLDPSSARFSQQRKVTAQRGPIQGLAVTALNQDDIETIAASGGAAGNVAVNISGAVSTTTSNTRAYIAEGAKVNDENNDAGDEQSVIVAAANDYSNMGIAASASIAGSVGVTPGAGVTVVKNTTEAYIADDVSVTAQQDIGVVAKSDEDILLIAATGAGAGTVAVAGSVATISIDNKTYAYIGDRDLQDNQGSFANAGGNILVAAKDDTKTLMIAGSLGVGIGAAGVGAAVGVTTIKKDTQAFIGGFSEITAKGNGAGLSNVLDGTTNSGSFGTKANFQGLAVQANSREDVFSVGAAGGGGLFAGLGGGVTVEIIDSDTQAFVGDRSVINSDTTGVNLLQSVNISAVNLVELFSFGGGLGVGIGGVGGGVNIGSLRNDTSAYFGNSSSIKALQDVNINALSNRDITTFGISGAAGGVGIAGSVSVWSIGSEFNSNYSDGGNRSDQAIKNDRLNLTTDNVDAATGEFTSILRKQSEQNDDGVYDRSRLTSNLTRISNGLDTNVPQVTGTITTTAVPTGTAAFIGKSVKVVTGRDLNIRAQDNLEFDVIAGGASAGVVGIGGSVAIAKVNNNTNSYIGDSALISTGGNLLVDADFDQKMKGRVYAGQNGNLGAVGAQIVILKDQSNQSAYLGQGVRVTQAEQVVIDANLNQELKVDSRAVTVGTLGFAAGISYGEVSTKKSKTQAYLGDGALIGGLVEGQTVEDLSLRAKSTRNLTADVIAASGGVVAGNGVVALATNESQTETRIAEGAKIEVGNDVNLLAQSNGNSMAQADGLSVAALGGLVATITRATVTPTVRAYLGRDAQVTAGGNVRFDAFANMKGEADGTGLAFGTGLAGAGASVTANVSPTVQAFSVGGGSITANDIYFGSRFNVDENGNKTQTRPAFSKVTLGSGALLGGFAGGKVNVDNSPKLRTSIASGTVINATGDVALQSRAFQFAGNDAVVGSGGIIAGISATVADVNTNGNITTYFDGTLQSAQNVALLSDVNAATQATGRAIGVGGVGGVGVANITATTSPNIRTYVGAGSQITANRDIELHSLVQTQSIAKPGVTSIAAGLAFSAVNATATAKPDIETYLEEARNGRLSAQLTSINGSVRLLSSHNFDRQNNRFLIENQVETVTKDLLTVALIAAVAKSDVKANAEAQVKTSVRAGTQISAGRDVVIDSRSSNFAKAEATSNGGAAISIQALNPIANAKGLTTTQVLGNVSQSKALVGSPDPNERIGIAGAQDITVTAQGSDLALSGFKTESGGLLSVTNNSNAKAIAAPTVIADIGRGEIAASNDINIQAISNTDADSTANTISGGLIRVANFSATAESTPTVRTTTADGGFIEAGGQLTIAAKHGINPDSNKPVIQFSDGSFERDEINPSNNTITLEDPHGLRTGNVITYNAPDSSNIVPGLGDSRNYNVIVTSERQIKFGSAFEAVAIERNQDQAQDREVSNPDAETDTITFSTPHNFETGDRVIYEPGDSPVGGLSAGSTYEVVRVDATRLKLKPVNGELPSSIFNPSSLVSKDDDKDTQETPLLENNEFYIPNHGFTDGQRLTYQSPKASQFLSQAVDVESIDNETKRPVYRESNNTIIVENHGYLTGDKVIYQANSNIPLGGLNFNTTYEVIKVNENRIQLRGETQIRDIVDDKDNVIGQEEIIQPTIDIDPINQNPIEPDSEGNPTFFEGDQFLRRAEELPIAGLANGDIYYVIRTGEDTFRLASEKNGPALTLSSVVNGTALIGEHKLFQESIDLTGPGSGQFILDITGTAGGTHQLDGVGDTSNAIGNPPGDNIVNASASGIGGGVVNISSVNSAASSTATVNTVIGKASTLQGRNINIAATSGSQAAAASRNRSGGFFSVSNTNANSVVNNTVETTIRQNANITAQENAIIIANSIQTGSASADTGSGSAIDFTEARSKANIDYTTKVNVDGNLTAGKELNIRSDSNVKGDNEAYADGAGLGVDADANNTDGNGIQIGSSNANTQTNLNRNAQLKAGEVTVEAVVSRLSAKAESRSDAAGFGVDSDARADVNINDLTEVKLVTGSVIEGSTVNLSSGHDNVDITANANARARSAGGDTDATARIEYNSESRITAEDEAEISASNLLVDTFQNIERLDRLAKRNVPDVNLGLFRLPLSVDWGSESRLGNDNAQRNIVWDANVRLGSKPSPELIVTENGTIQRLINVSARSRSAAGQLSAPLQVGDVIPVGSTLVLDDIAYGQGQGISARFQANDPDIGDVTSKIRGTQGLFAYQQTLDAVQITNRSDRPIEVNNIDVVNQASQLPTIEIDVDSSPAIEAERFNFDIKQSFDPTKVSIQTLHAQPSDITDIILNGTINNPVGETVIFNTSGDIRASKSRGTNTPDGREALIQTGQLNLLASQGNIGDSINQRLNVNLISSPDNTLKTSVQAQDDVYLDLKGIFRVPEGTVVSDPAFAVDSIKAGKDIDLLLRESVQEVSSGRTGGIEVFVVKEDFRDTYSRYFRPDPENVEPPVVGIGAYGGASSILSNSNYRFENRDSSGSFTGNAGLEAGRDIIVRQDLEATGTIDVTGRTNFLPNNPLGQLDVVISGEIDLTESDGTLNVRLAESTQKNVRLTVEESSATDEDLLIDPTGVVKATQGNIDLRAGDDIRLSEGGIIQAQGTVTIRGDFENADSEGSVVDLRGTITGSSAEVLTEQDNDIVSLTNVEANTPTTVRTQAGNDLIQVGSNASVQEDSSGQPIATNTGGTLNQISGLLTVDGGTDNDQLQLDESADIADNNGILRQDRLVGLGMGDSDQTVINEQLGIAYNNLERLELPLGSGNDELTIESSHRGVTVVQAANGNDIINVGNSINGVDEINGPVFLSGQDGASPTGKDTLNILDTVDRSDNVGRVTDSQITGLDMAGVINYDTFEVLNVELGVGSDQLDVDSTGAGETTVKAGPGNDTITASLTTPVGENIAVINGQTGNDIINASASTLGMVLNGDEGNDRVEAGSGNDLIGGGSGDDWLDGNGGRDEIYGDSSFAANATDAEYDGFTFPGNAQSTPPTSRPLAAVQENPGNDAIQGGADEDTIYGEDGNDNLIGGSNEAGISDSVDHLYGGAGDDAVAGDNATIDPATGTITPLDAINGAGDLIFGDSGEIVVTTATGEVTLTARGRATPGDDRAVGGVGQDVILGDQGRVSLSNGQIIRVETTQANAGGNDDLVGNQDRDVILGGQGNDIIEGNAGQDALLGDNGQVDYQGGIVKDILTSDSAVGGQDRIEGGSDNDVILAGAGDDFVQGGRGQDAIAGDNGIATFAFGGDNNAPADMDLSTLDLLTVVDPTLGGSDILLGGLDDDTIFGGTADDRIHGDGFSVTNSSEETPIFNGTAIALGDFDRDGNLDIVLFNPTTRQLGIQYIQGNSVRETQILQAPIIRDLNWSVVAAADFTGDGVSELIWQNQRTQQVVFWQIANHRVVGAIAPQLNRLGNEWQIAGVADFNSDGQADLFWQNQRDGRTRALLMQGSQGTQFVDINPAVAITTAASARALRQSLIQTRTARPFSNPEQSWQASIARENSQSGSDADLLLGDHGRRYFNLPFEASYRSIAISATEDGGNDTIFGGQGDDKILGQQGADNLNGGTGEDDIIGGHNVLGGSDANDTISGGEQADVVLGDNGTITRRPLTPNGRDWERYAAPFDDVIREVVRFDDVDGVAGDDLIRGDGGDDILHGQRGNDQIEGGAGDDEIYGELGNDTLFGNEGQDTILGDVGLIQRSLNPDGTPQVRANGSWQRNVILTDVGRVLSSQAISSLNAAQLAAADTVLLSGLYNSKATNTAPSGTAAQRIAFVPDGNDRIDGGSGDDRLWGQRGQDTLFGQTGQDYLEGNAGDDRLDGGADADWVIGDDGSTLTPEQDTLPTVNRGIHLIATDTAAVQLDRFGNVVLPGIRLDANPFHGLLPVLSLTPEISQDSRLRPLISGLSTPQGQIFQPLIQIIPDLANHRDLLMGQDQLQGGSGQDTVIGDRFSSLMPLRTGNARIDREVEELIRELYQTSYDLHDLEVLIQPAGQTLVLGQDSLDGGGDNDFVVGDNGISFGPFEQANPSEPSFSLAEVQALRLLLQQFDNRVTALIPTTSNNPINTLRLGNDSLRGGSGNDSLFGDDAVVISPLLDTVPYAPKSFWDYGFSQERRPGSRRINDWTVVWGNDQIEGGNGLDFAIGDYGTLLTPVVTASTADTAALQISLINLTADLNAFIRDNFQADNGLSNSLRNQTFQAGQDSLSGGASDDVLIGDNATLLLPFINGQVDNSLSLSRERLDTLDQAQNFFHGLPHQMYTQPRSIRLGLPNFAVDALSGGEGNDILFGLRGPDTLNGDQGDDFLFGGDEADNLLDVLGNNIQRSTNPSRADLRNIRIPVNVRLAEVLSPGLREQLLLIASKQRSLSPNGRLVAQLT